MDLKHWARLHWDRIGAWTLAFVGVVVLLVGWQHVADTPFPAEQIPYVVSAGIGGGLLVVFGAALLISADLRDEWAKLDEIQQTLARQQSPVSAEHANGSAASPAPVDEGVNGNQVNSAPRRRLLRAGTTR